VYETETSIYMRPRPRPRPITVRPRPIPRPKKWSRDHSGLETLTSLVCTNNNTCRLSEGGQVFLSGSNSSLLSLDCLTEVGRRFYAATGNARETAFLFQRISDAIQRFKLQSETRIHECFVVAYLTSSWSSSYSNMCFFIPACVFSPLDHQ